MRILYHHRTQAEDAQGIHIHEIIRCFREQGHEVLEVSLVDSEAKQVKREGGRFWNQLSDLVPDVGYEVLEMLYNPVGYAKLEQAAAGFRPDVIYERYALYNACGVLAAKRLQIPLILEVNAPMAREQADLGKLTFNRAARLAERMIASAASRTLAVSTPLKRILVEEGVPADQIEVTINGVNPDQFHGRDTGGEVRKRYGLDGKQVVGFCGWIREWHGLTELVQAMATWQGPLADTHLLVVGDGPARKQLEEAAKAARVADRVHVTGAVDRNQVVDHLAVFTVALQPSSTVYASPMKVFEYLAMGKPVIACRQENLTEILTEEKNALFFEPGNLADLTEKTRQILENRARLEKMTRWSRETIFERGYLWSKNARRAVEIARSLT